MKNYRKSITGLAIFASGMMFLMTANAAAQSGATREGCGYFMQRFDKDADGKVSEQEFPGRSDRFAELDSNDDGYIEAAEVPRGHHKGKGNFIERFDSDKDGKVSLAEFRGPAEQRFARMDSNGDGFIEASEAPKGSPHHRRRGDFIARFDSDSDGKVSQEEFPGLAEHFAGLDSNGDGFIEASEAPKGPPPCDREN